MTDFVPIATEFVHEKRQQKRCPETGCGKTNIYFRLDPLPYSKALVYICSDCGCEFLAKRDSDIREFKKQAIEFTK
jgi:hypothetical protein